MSAGAFVNFPKKSNAIFGCDASLENAYCAVFVEFSLNYGEGLGVVHDLTMMDSVFGKLASQEVGEVWLRPYYFD
jgi:hypothetical protein